MNIDKLVKQENPADIAKTDAEITREAYLRQIEEMKDFSRPEDKISWPSPVGPKWKN